MDRHDPCMIQERNGLGLILKSAQLCFVCQNPGPDDLGGYWPVDPDLAGLVHHPPPAPSQFLLKLVVPEVSDERALSKPRPGIGPVDRCIRVGRSDATSPFFRRGSSEISCGRLRSWP